MSDSDKSIWKKDLSFGRTPEDERGADEQETAKLAAAVPGGDLRPPTPPPPPAETAREATGLEGVRRTAPHEPPFVREQGHAESDPPPPPPAPAPQRPALHPVEPEPGHGLTESPRPPLPPAAATPATVVVHPPVPASELPPDPATEKKSPFWKKDLGRSAKAKVPKGEAPKRTAKPNTEKKADPPRVVRDPVWKRNITLKRPVRKIATAEAGKQTRRLVGLKIGASQLAAARVVNGGAPELIQIARMELRPGIVVGGELRDPEALAEALKTFFEKNKLPKREVRLGIANNRIGVRTFEVSGIDDPRQLDNAVRFRAQEALPIPIDEAVLDYQVLSEGHDADGNPVKRILLVVAYRELVDRYAQACRKAGIRLVGIDLEAFALLRAISAPRSQQAESNGAVVAVAVGHQRSTFAVSDGRSCQFTRVLDWGGNSLDIAISRQLDLPIAQAGPIKRRVSLVPGAAPPSGLPDDQAAQVMEAVRNSLQAFARELVSSLQYYQNQPESLGIGEIVLTGGTAHLPGIAEELQRLTGVLVRIGDPLGRVKVGKRVQEGDQIGSLAVAIGLGIED